MGGYTQTTSSSSDSNTFSGSSISNSVTLPANTYSSNLTTILQTFDNGDSAAISEALFTVTVAPTATPEPSTLLLMGFGGGCLLWRGLKRHNRANAVAVLAIGSMAVVSANAQKTKPGADQDLYQNMSPMGRLARTVNERLKTLPSHGAGSKVHMAVAPNKVDQCDNLDEDCSDMGFTEGPSGGQAELSIAVDPSGQHIVVGFNDTRGFGLNPISVSGFAYSDNGGVSFTDGGQLPAGPTTTIGTTKYPQVFGDSDIKFVPGGSGCQFIYSSIFVKATSATATAQTMSLHRSTDCGHTWQGPFEVTAATLPHAGDASDKEFIDVDPETNRVLISWSNFTATNIEIRTAYSDDLMTAATPTWSAGVIIASGNFTGSVPRFAGNGSSNAYVAYSSSSTNVGFSRSTDNGVTWSAPVNVSAANYIAPDQVIGSDRINSFPSMAVDNSPGANRGNIYIAAATQSSVNSNIDITLWRSTDGGLTFGPGKMVDPNPGADRAQWFPFIAVDKSNGRVNVMYDDQHVAASGDLTEMTRTYSDDAGSTFSVPTPLTGRPFHANYGNDTGQPNIGDYNSAVAQNGTFYAAYSTTPNQASFVDLQPTGTFPYPSFLPIPNPPGFAKVTGGKAALSLGTVAFTESGGNGFVDAGDQVRYRLPLTNYVQNAAVGATTYTGVSGTLSTGTGGVSILAATRSYPNLAPGASAINTADFVLTLAPGFVPGTPIEFVLTVTTGQGTTTLPFTQQTGTPVTSTVLSENFDSIAPGSLPAGWGTIHQGGSNTVAWTTRAGFCGGATNALYHQELEDGATTNATRFERVASPNISIPAEAAYSTIDFDICYNLEDDAQYGGYPVLAYDGAHLRLTDFTPGHAAVAVWAEAFAADFFTGSIYSYPKHAPRSSSSAYFQDIPMWSGNSGGFQHVSMRLPGTAGTTFQFRPDYTQDANGTCVAGGTACGVAIDNLVVRSVTLKSDELSVLTLRPVAGQTGVYTGTVTSQAIAPTGGILVALSSSAPAQTTLPASVTIPAGAQVSPSFNVTVTARGTLVTITGTGPSNARSAGVTVSQLVQRRLSLSNDYFLRK